MSRPGKIARLLMRSMFRKPATLNYPAHWSGMPQGFRGKLKYNPLVCTGCRICMHDCPSGAIVIEEVGEKKFKARINLGKCIYCCQCVDSCPKKALEATGEFELARLDPGQLEITFEAGIGDDSKK
jgi:formate hydrogenlyase subunit 6/NADH:ubiquinone oxidoreductase subunit I